MTRRETANKLQENTITESKTSENSVTKLYEMSNFDITICDRKVHNIDNAPVVEITEM